MRILILPTFALMLVAAGPSESEFGASVRNNIAVQTVDMAPRYEGKLMEGGVGQRGAAAVRRYMTDKIRPLAQVGGKAEVGSQGGAASGTPK